MNAETTVTFRGDVAGLDVHDVSRRRSTVAHPGLDGVDSIGRSFQPGLDASVGTVGDPARDAVTVGEVTRGGAEEHALDTPVHHEMSRRRRIGSHTTERSARPQPGQP